MADPRLTDEEARALWKRAAQLQAAAENAATQSRMLEPVQRGELTVEQVTTAAREAGIDPEYVHIVVAEQRLPDFDALRHDTRRARLLGRIIREPHAFERERIIAADPATVLSAFRTVATSSTFQLMPENTVGTDPLRDGVLVYRITHGTQFGTTMDFADARVLLVRIRPHERGTRVRIRVPLFRRGVNLGAAAFSASLFGAGGGTLLGWAAASLGATALTLAAPVTAGVIAGAAFGTAGMRRMYRAARSGGERQIDLLLQAVAVEAGAPPA